MEEPATYQDSPDNTTPCRRCGTCCTMHQAFVNPSEIRRIVDFLGITAGDWEGRYADSRWEYNNYYLIRHVDGACAFLEYENGLAACAVHAVKPGCCAAWKPGPERRECREGIKKAAG